MHRNVRPLRATIAAVLALAGTLASSAAMAQAQTTPCHFQLGFQALHDAVPDAVGQCLENEHYNAIGDSNQLTTGGLLAWRKADNWTAFTDGYRTWVNGPDGVQQRLNTERYPWEHDLQPIGTPAPPAPSTDTVPPVMTTTNVAQATPDTTTQAAMGSGTAGASTATPAPLLDSSGNSVICRDGTLLSPGGSCAAHGGRF